MSNTAQAPSNPLLRKHGLRDSRALDGIDAARPAPNNAFMFSRPMPGGVALMPQPRARGSSIPRHPFQCPAFVRDGGISVYPGTVNGKTANGGYDLSVSESSEVHIYLRVQPTFSDYEDYITGAGFETFTLFSNFDVPSDSSTSFFKPIAVYNNGVKIAQYVQHSLDVHWCGPVDEPNVRWTLSG